jgi:hypothetical protein
MPDDFTDALLRAYAHAIGPFDELDWPIARDHYAPQLPAVLAVARVAVERAAEAVRGERLESETGDAADAAYDLAIDHCLEALDALLPTPSLQEGERGGASSIEVADASRIK